MLIGYEILGRGMAYLGFGGVYVGDYILIAGILLALKPGRPWGLTFRPVILFWGLFVTWGLIRTIPYIQTYGLNTARDAVLWGYSLYFLLVAIALRRIDTFWLVLSGYTSWIRPYLLLSPVLVFIQRYYGDDLPLIPGTKMQILNLRFGEIAPHVAAGLMFLLLSLDKPFEKSRQVQSAGISDTFSMLASILVLISAGTWNRGSFLAAVCCVTICYVFGKRLRLSLTFLLPAACLLLTCAFTFVSVETPDAYNRARSMSSQQLLTNLLSLASDQHEELQGTKEWRINWWKKIWGYAAVGDYKWKGKGFGVNLRIDDGIQSDPTDRLRSPHNGHLTILARMGLPGIVLWGCLQLAWLLALARRAIRARKRGQVFWSNLLLWLIGYWAAFLVNASFDVFLEGPQGGIWFWCVFGFGIAAANAYDKVEKNTRVQLPVFAYRAAPLRDRLRAAAV